jgi:hypothetical protein
MTPENCRPTEILSPKTQRQLAHLYAEVFGALPWNEVWRCPQCNRFYGPSYSQSSPSPCCTKPLATAYPETDTISYILGELSKPSAQLRLVINDATLPFFYISEVGVSPPLRGNGLGFRISGFLDRINPDRTLFIDLP